MTLTTIVQLVGHRGSFAGLMGTYKAEGRLFNSAPKYRFTQVYKRANHIYLYFSSSQGCWYVGDLKCLEKGAGGLLKGTPSKSKRFTSAVRSPLDCTQWHTCGTRGWEVDSTLRPTIATQYVLTQDPMKPDSAQVLRATTNFSGSRNPFTPRHSVSEDALQNVGRPSDSGVLANRNTTRSNEISFQNDDDDDDIADDEWGRNRSNTAVSSGGGSELLILGFTGTPSRRKSRGFSRGTLSTPTSRALTGVDSGSVSRHQSPVVNRAATAAAKRRSVHLQRTRQSSNTPPSTPVETIGANPKHAAEVVADFYKDKTMQYIALMEEEALTICSQVVGGDGLRSLLDRPWQDVLRYHVVFLVMIRREKQAGSVCPVKTATLNLFREVMRRVSPDKSQREFAPPPESNEDCPAWLRERALAYKANRRTAATSRSGSRHVQSRPLLRCGAYWNSVQDKLAEWQSLAGAQSSSVPPVAVAELLRVWASYLARDLGIVGNVRAQEALLILTEHLFYPQISEFCHSYGRIGGVTRYDTAYRAQLPQARVELATRLFASHLLQQDATSYSALPKFLLPASLPNAPSTRDELLTLLNGYISSSFPRSLAAMASLDSCSVPCECLRRILAVVKFIIPQEATQVAERNGTRPPSVFGADELWPILFAVSIAQGGPTKLQSMLWFTRLFTLDDLDASGGDYYLTTLQEAIVDNVLKQNPYSKVEMYDPESLLPYPESTTQRALAHVDAHMARCLGQRRQ